MQCWVILSLFVRENICTMLWTGCAQTYIFFLFLISFVWGQVVRGWRKLGNFSCSCVLYVTSYIKLIFKKTKKLTVDGRATDQVGVGEEERSVQMEVRLQHLLQLLAEVEKQTSALQWNLPLLSELQKAQTPFNRMKLMKVTIGSN